MKYVVLVPDGCADEPLAELGDRTPLEAARMPHLAALAARGEVGLTNVIPEGLPPGSDVGNLAILGYDPAVYHTGRAPIEAAAMGIELAPDEVAYRCNLVTVDDGTMVDFAGRAPHERAEPSDHRRPRRRPRRRPGRRALPPRRRVPPHLRGAPRARRRRMCAAARPHRSRRSAPDRSRGGEAGRAHGRVAARRASGRGRGGIDRHADLAVGPRRPAADPRLRADLRRAGADVVGGRSRAGLGVLTGIEVVDVPGATAGFDNDYGAQCDAAIASLADRDFFLLHVEATDEAGHQGAVDEKVASLERWDSEIIGPLVDALDGSAFRVLLMPDHATPCAARTHTSAPVPYLLFDSEVPGPGGEYTERGVAGKTPVIAHQLMARLVR